MRLKQKKNKKQRRAEHPDDADHLIMDAIYNSPKSEVQDYFRQVSREEGLDIDRIHMRMGVRFFDLLPPIMQQRFWAEYPTACVFGAGMNENDKQLATVA